MIVEEDIHNGMALAATNGAYGDIVETLIPLDKRESLSFDELVARAMQRRAEIWHVKPDETGMTPEDVDNVTGLPNEGWNCICN